MAPPAYIRLTNDDRDRLIAEEPEEIAFIKLRARYFGDWLFDRMGEPGPLFNSEYSYYAMETGCYAMTRAQWTRALTAIFGGSVQFRGPDGRVRGR